MIQLGIRDFLLDLIFDWDDIEDYTKYVREEPTEQQLARDAYIDMVRSASVRPKPQKVVQPMVRNTQSGVLLDYKGPSGEWDPNARSYEYQLEQQEEVSYADRAYRQNQEADLWRMGY